MVGPLPAGLSCGHRLCARCIAQIAESSPCLRVCPVCRRESAGYFDTAEASDSKSAEQPILKKRKLATTGNYLGLALAVPKQPEAEVSFDDMATMLRSYVAGEERQLTRLRAHYSVTCRELDDLKQKINASGDRLLQEDQAILCKTSKIETLRRALTLLDSAGSLTTAKP